MARPVMISHAFLKWPIDRRSIRRLTLIGNVLLGLLVGQQIIMLFGFLGQRPEGALPAEEVPRPTGEVSAASLTVSSPNDITSQPLELVQLFGAPPTAQRQEPVRVAPEARLNLTLRGVIHSTNAGTARAIIAESNGRDVAYPLGAWLPGGARLTRINHRNVVVSHSGREELLPLSSKGAPGGEAAPGS